MAVKLVRRYTSNALYVCLAAMDGCWVYLVAWLVSTFVWSRLAVVSVPTPLILALIELLSVWLSGRLLKSERLPEWLAQGLAGLAGLAVALLVALLIYPPGPGGISPSWVGGALIGILACLGVWFVGGLRAADPPSFNQAFNMFRLGLVVIGIAAALTALLATGGGNEAWAGLGGVSVWFFAWSLAALALGNREVVREEAGSASTGSWTLVLLVSIGAIMLIGSTASVLGAGGVLGFLQNMVASVLLIVGAVIYLVMWAIFQLVGVFRPEKKRTGEGPKEVEDAFRIIGRNNTPEGMELAFKGLGISPEVYNLLVWGAVALLALVVIWLVSRGVRRSRVNAGADAQEERERIGSWDLLVSQMRAWWNMLLARFRPAPAPANAERVDDLAALRGKPEWSGTLNVRQIYARLQRLAADTGYPRDPQQTPVEYLRVLEGAMPDMRPEWGAITSAYLEARYGPVPASGPAVYAAQEAWKRAEPRLQSAASAQGRRAPS